MRCSFCALPEMPWAEEPWKLMEVELFEKIVEDLRRWRPKHRMEISERGEPTFHPRALDFLRIARDGLPKAQLTMLTNGDLINKLGRRGFRDWTEEAFDAGLNILMLDCYDSERYRTMCDLFPDAEDFFEDNSHPYTYRSSKTRTMIVVDATPGRDNLIRTYHNYAGTVNAARAQRAGFPIDHPERPLRRECYRPFRELVIHFDGEVPLCCLDWHHHYVAGRFPADGSLEEIWHGGLDPARRELLALNRAGIRPCSRCSERTGFRFALERDWFGERISPAPETEPQPTQSLLPIVADDPRIDR